VNDGRTGVLIDPDAATPADIAARIAALWSDRATYDRMARAAREDYEQRLNWNRFGERFNAVVESAIR
jgi:glycosyltransferase involved in cell wall biosynthesis